MFVCHFQLPEEARELEKELRQITKEKNEAVRSQDFEKVYPSLLKKLPKVYPVWFGFQQSFCLIG